MKICIVTDTWQQINGVSTTLKNTVKCLRQMGHEVLVIEPSQFFHMPMPGYREVQWSLDLWNVGRRIAKFHPHAIHIATEGPLGFAARWYCKVTRRSIPHNTSYHTKMPEYLQKKFGVPVSWSYPVFRMFHKYSHRVLVTNKTMVRELAAQGFAKLTVWSRGVDQELFTPELRSPVSQHDLGPAPIIMCVSRVSHEKNLEAFCELRTAGTLVVVGDGPTRAELQRRYPAVKWLGYKTGTELAKCYANADVFVFPSKTDTFGVVMLESMACGTPVAAYPVTGPVDVVEQNITGILHEDLQTAMEQALLLDRNTVHQASARWTWQSCTETFVQNLITISH